MLAELAREILEAMHSAMMDRGYTVNALAEASGVSNSSLKRMLASEETLLHTRFDTVLRVLNALGIDLVVGGCNGGTQRSSDTRVSETDELRELLDGLKKFASDRGFRLSVILSFDSRG